jgi:hypothetical protein
MKRELKLRGAAVVTSLSLMFTIPATGEVIEQKPIPIVEEQPAEEVETPVVMTEEEQESTITNFINEQKENLKKLINDERFDEAKAKLKEYFVTGVDFIFFDKPIKGVYFKDLKADFKKYTMYNIESAAEQIEEWFPGLLEKIGTKYEIARMFINEKYVEYLDKIKAYLGEEDWNALIDIKDKLRDSFNTKKTKWVLTLVQKYLEWKDE